MQFFQMFSIVLVTFVVLFKITVSRPPSAACRLQDCVGCYAAGCEWCSIPTTWAKGLGVGFCSDPASKCNGYKGSSKIKVTDKSRCFEATDDTCLACFETSLGGWCDFEMHEFIEGGRCLYPAHERYCDSQGGSWISEVKKCTSNTLSINSLSITHIAFLATTFVLLSH